MTTIIGKSFISVATNGYLLYWKAQIHSLIKSKSLGRADQIIIFTNETQAAKVILAEFGIDDALVLEIPNYGWPEATLFRYEIMNVLELHDTKSILVYLDADMLIHKDLSRFINFEKIIQSKAMLLVRHPGFWRGRILTRSRIYAKDPMLAFRDIYLKIRNGGLGSWETRRSSSAHVSYWHRRVYFCGGIWLGAKAEFLKLVLELSRNVRQDYEMGLIAKWHDESHLNCWASRNFHHVMDPRLCYDPIYRHLESLTMVVEAVRK